MRGVSGVADQDDVPVRPALVPDRREVPPEGSVLQDRVALELVGEQLLRERDGVVLGRLVEACPAPGGVRRLQDERGVPCVVAIGVDPPEPVHVLLEDEGERRERERRAQPDEAVGPPRRCVAGSARRARPGSRCSPRRRRGSGPRAGTGQVAHLRLELELDAQVDAPTLKDVEESLARHPGEAVAGRGDHGRPGSGCRCRPSGRRPGRSRRASRDRPERSDRGSRRRIRRRSRRCRQEGSARRR